MILAQNLGASDDFYGVRRKPSDGNLFFAPFARIRGTTDLLVFYLSVYTLKKFGNYIKNKAFVQNKLKNIK